MNKKGFTLIELLAVIVILAIISTIGMAGLSAVRKNINENMWESTVAYIETCAEKYGNDNKNRLVNTCTVGGSTKTKCIEISVQKLIDKNYIKTKETDDDNNKVMINNTLEKDQDGYYVNGKDVFVYIEDNMVYAKYQG